MTAFLKLGKWLPLAILVALALAYEPLRSEFTFANQSCELITNWETIRNAIFNPRHIIAYGILFLVAAATLRQNKILKAAIGVFLFSAFLEVEQSFFVTGHCRSWDLVPNMLAITWAAVVFCIGVYCYNKMAALKKTP